MWASEYVEGWETYERVKEKKSQYQKGGIIPDHLASTAKRAKYEKCVDFSLSFSLVLSLSFSSLDSIVIFGCD
jgi:hypothetical protein